MADRVTPTDWDTEDVYWRTAYRTRPYASDANRAYTVLPTWLSIRRRIGESIRRTSMGRVEPDLQLDWDRYEHRAQSTWEQMKSAVRDAWDRVTGKAGVGSR